ncbi:kelch-like ECH-associated protein 1 [Paramacrobiotus metropolitanus]|uniref:kelch-like ECH-associated protein 1 n=1 Tax=Paramacrobiotus metropolitanus TaxID=2943436 RepID=UPI00244627BD|nr:kelch-like ECH-associated protein 1 [Paramacrobiotus metropolitanus]
MEDLGNPQNRTITLLLNGTVCLRAERQLLTKLSPNYFRPMLQHGQFSESHHDEIRLMLPAEFNAEAGKQLLEGILSQRNPAEWLPTTDADLADFLILADYFGFDDVADVCGQRLLEFITPDNACFLWKLGDVCRVKTLMEGALRDVLRKGITDLIELPEFLECGLTALLEFLSYKNLVMKSEEEVLNLVLAWCNFAKDSRWNAETLDMLLPKLHLDRIPNEISELIANNSEPLSSSLRAAAQQQGLLISPCGNELKQRPAQHRPAKQAILLYTGRPTCRYAQQLSSEVPEGTLSILHPRWKKTADIKFPWEDLDIGRFRYSTYAVRIDYELIFQVRWTLRRGSAYGQRGHPPGTRVTMDPEEAEEIRAALGGLWGEEAGRKYRLPQIGVALSLRDMSYRRVAILDFQLVEFDKNPPAAVGSCVYGWNPERQFVKCDVEMNAVTVLASPRFAKIESSVAVSGTTLLYCGGRTASVMGSVKALTTVEAYDTLTDQWRILPPMAYDREKPGVLVNGDYLYVCGGYTTEMDYSDRYVGCYLGNYYAERLHLQTEIWEPLPRMQYSRHGHGMFEWGGLIVAMGGSNLDLFLENVEAYDPQKNCWATIDMPEMEGLELSFFGLQITTCFVVEVTQDMWECSLFYDGYTGEDDSDNDEDIEEEDTEDSGHDGGEDSDQD